MALGAAAVLVAWKLGVDLEMLKWWWSEAEGFLMERPWCLFAGLVFLPGLPVPTSALMLLAGTVWRDRPVMACALCVLALALNMCWTYWLAAFPGRKLVEKVLETGSIRVPELPKGNHLRLTLVLRLTPGIPMFMQNYLLGFFRVPFFLYLPVSLGCSGLVCCGVVLSGAGVASGNLMPVISGVGLIVAGVVVVQMLRKKLGSKC